MEREPFADHSPSSAQFLSREQRRFFLSVVWVSALVWCVLTVSVVMAIITIPSLRTALQRAIYPSYLSTATTTSATPTTPPPSNHEARVVAVVAHALPAVVSIVGERTHSMRAPYLFSRPLPLPLPTPRLEGTGFFVSGSGIIVTNRHVVADEEASYTVILNNGARLPVQRIWRDPFVDIAFLKVAVRPPAVLPLGTSKTVNLGQTVVAIGNALGRFTNSVSVGVLSGKGRSIVAMGSSQGPEALESVLQTDAAINPGNSGGPLLTLDGKVVGVNVAVVEGAQNIGFAIPAEVVAPILRSIEQSGEIVRPWLGVRYVTITPTLAEQKELPVDYGALVVEGDHGEPAVIPGSPAAKAGIQPGDIITAVDGVRVTQQTPLGTLIRQRLPGDRVTLDILRDGVVHSVEVTLDRAPLH